VKAMGNGKLIDFNLSDGRKVYFSPYSNRFWLDEKPEEIVCDYYDTTLTEMRLEITHLCNGNCKYCIVFGNEIEQFETLDVKESWEWFKAQPWFKNIKKIFIIGGEPLMCFDDIAFILENFEGEVRFTTNGTLITREMAQKLAKHDVLVYISLDGPNFQDNLMRVYKDDKYMYEDVIKGLNLLIEEGVRYGIFMVATKDNVRTAVDTIKQIDDMFHPERIGYSMPHWTNNNSDEISGEEYGEALLSLYKNRKNIKAEVMQVNWRIKPLWQGKIKKFSCALHTTQTTVLPDKSIVRCSKIDNDSVFRQVGNEELNQNCPVSLAEKENQACTSCLALASCGGGCPFDGLKRFGEVIDRRECIITPPVVKLAINEIITGLEKRKDLPKGLIGLVTIKEILYTDV
jgi:radical SAM protein with 4Fe4S-binding SPASM domain